MKKISSIIYPYFLALLCIFMLCSEQLANAQTSKNTIVNDYSSWAVLITESGMIPNPSLTTLYYYLDGDSVFRDKSYKKMFSCDDELHKNIRFEGLIREENLKTYMISKDFHAPLDTEFLLYDFSLEAGLLNTNRMC